MNYFIPEMNYFIPEMNYFIPENELCYIVKMNHASRKLCILYTGK